MARALLSGTGRFSRGLMLEAVGRDEATPECFHVGAAELPESLSDWADCRRCGALNGTDREGCLSCGASLHLDSNTSDGPPPRTPEVWLSTQFLDAGARHALTQIFSPDSGRFVTASA